VAGATMRDKLCVVTGGTSGIGRVTALALARMGAEVVVVGRDRARADATVDAVRTATGSRAVSAALADLSSQRSIHALADELRDRRGRVDVLVNNAGAIFGERSLTADGVERTFALNHLAYFLLTALLLDALRAAAADGGDARVVNVASEAHRSVPFEVDNLQAERRFTPFRAYATSKLANVLFTHELSRRLAGSGVTANALHPGLVRTGFGRGGSRRLGVVFTLLRPFMIGPEQGAATSVHLASSATVAGVSGAYFVKCKEARSSAASYDAEAGRALWQISERLTPLPAPLHCPEDAN
jgi:NAD(P)-dependent dehydrogenase (short-subunit alcohol dehydrogenase family)